MGKDQATGALILVASIVGILVYGWLVFLTGWSMLVLQLTGFVAITGILGILSWIGYTLATTSPPQPIESMEPEPTQRDG